MKEAILYARVSTTGQSEGTSLDTQLRDCRAYAREMGYEVIGEMSDVYTGSSMTRTGLEAVLVQARARLVNVVVCYAVDRASRALSDLLMLDEELERNGVTLEFVKDRRDEGPSGSLLFQIRGAFSEYERNTILERVRRGKDATAARGIIINTTFVAYGYRYDAEGRTLEIEEPAASVVRAIFEGYVRDGLSLYALAQRLNEREIPTPRGSPFWQQSTLRSILDNEVYMGRFAWNKHRKIEGPNGKRRVVARPPDEWLYTAVPAIVSEELWHQAQLTRQHNRRFSPRNTRHEYLLTGILYCGGCHYRMSARTGYGERNTYYLCPSQHDAAVSGDPAARCAQRNVRGDVVDALVWAKVAEALSDRQLLEGAVKRQEAKSAGARTDHHSAQLERSLATLRTRQSRLLDAYLNGTTIDQPTYEARALAIKKEIQHVERELSDRRMANQDEQKRREQLRDMLDNFQRIAANLRDVPFTARRAFLLRYGVRVRLAPDARSLSIDGLPTELNDIPIPEPERKVRQRR